MGSGKDKGICGVAGSVLTSLCTAPATEVVDKLVHRHLKLFYKIELLYIFAYLVSEMSA